MIACMQLHADIQYVVQECVYFSPGIPAGQPPDAQGPVQGPCVVPDRALPLQPEVWGGVHPGGTTGQHCWRKTVSLIHAIAASLGGVVWRRQSDENV